MNSYFNLNNLHPDESGDIDRKKIDFLRRRMDFLYSFDMLSKKIPSKDITKINIVQIAQNAGLTKPTFYRYFQNKNDFLIGFAAYTYEKLTKMIQKQLSISKAENEKIKETPKSSKNDRTLLSLVLAYYQFTKNHPASVQILNEVGQKDTVSLLNSKYQENQMGLTQSEEEYLRAWKKFRDTIQKVFDEKNVEKILGSYPEFAINDISEIFLLVFNGIITEFTQKNRILQNKGIREEKIIEIIVNLISKGMESFS